MPVAIVTGASRGIGRGIAHQLACGGMHVVLCARSADMLEDVRAAILADGGSAETRACDIGDADALATMIRNVAEEHERLDVLVNNAGVTRDGLVLRMSDEDFDEVIRINLKAAFVACREAARPMLKARFGRIINIGSIAGITGNAGQANYAAAKAGLTALSRSLALELGKKGVTVNVIAPGFIETDMTAALSEQAREAYIKTIPMGRFGTPADIAHAVDFLVSKEAGFITGQVLVVDGGMVH